MITQLKESYSIVALCQVFNVHRSSYRAWFSRPSRPSAGQAKAVVMVMVKKFTVKVTGQRALELLPPYQQPEAYHLVDIVLRD
ncbi:MAG: hypothetical protein ACI9N9_002734 [Enterobacterales bacterium]|jgi:hypothetical protein